MKFAVFTSITDHATDRRITHIQICKHCIFYRNSITISKINIWLKIWTQGFKHIQTWSICGKLCFFKLHKPEGGFERIKDQRICFFDCEFSFLFAVELYEFEEIDYVLLCQCVMLYFFNTCIFCSHLGNGTPTSD